MPRKVKVVSARDLSRSIDKAVKVAMKKADFKAEKNTLLINWEIIGRLVRTQNIGEAFRFAEEVSSRVETSGILAQPTCCKIDGLILAGFIERLAAPKEIGF